MSKFLQFTDWIIWFVSLKVDGEPCRLAPSVIYISLRNQANMIQKTKRRTSLPHLNEYDFVNITNWNSYDNNSDDDDDEVCLSTSQQHVPDRLRIRVSRISMADYEALHYDKDKLRQACKDTQ